MSVTRLGPGAYPIAGHVPQTFDLAIVEAMNAVDVIDIHLLAGIIYQHEIGNDAAGLPLVSSLRSGYFYLDEGENFVVVDEVLPDFKFAFQGAPPNAQIQMTFFVVNYPGDTPLVYGPYTVTATTQSFFTRFRVRQMAIEVSSSDLGSFWRLGKVRFRFAPSGRR